MLLLADDCRVLNCTNLINCSVFKLKTVHFVGFIFCNFFCEQVKKWFHDVRNKKCIFSFLNVTDEHVEVMS